MKGTDVTGFVRKILGFLILNYNTAGYICQNIENNLVSYYEPLMSTEDRLNRT